MASVIPFWYEVKIFKNWSKSFFRTRVRPLWVRSQIKSHRRFHECVLHELTTQKKNYICNKRIKYVQSSACTWIKSVALECVTPRQIYYFIPFLALKMAAAVHKGTELENWSDNYYDIQILVDSEFTIGCRYLMIKIIHCTPNREQARKSCFPCNRKNHVKIVE